MAILADREITRDSASARYFSVRPLQIRCYPSLMPPEIDSQQLARLRTLADAARLSISDERLAEIAPLAEILLDRFGAFAELDLDQVQPASNLRPPRPASG